MNSKKSMVMFLGTLLCVSFAFATDIPGTISFQGRLIENGVPAAGTKDIRFRIYNTGPGTGGTILFGPETHAGISLGPGGVFQTLIGANTSGGIPKGVFSGTTAWIEVAISTPGGAFEIQAPRTRMVSVPYAFFSSSASFAGNASFATNAGTATFATTAGTASFLLGGMGVDAATLSTVQTFTGAKTFSAPTTFTNNIVANTAGTTASLSTTTVFGNLNVQGRLTGDGSGLTGIAGAGSIVTLLSTASAGGEEVNDNIFVDMPDMVINASGPARALLMFSGGFEPLSSSGTIFFRFTVNDAALPLSERQHHYGPDLSADFTINLVAVHNLPSGPNTIKVQWRVVGNLGGEPVSALHQELVVQLVQ